MSASASIFFPRNGGDNNELKIPTGGKLTSWLYEDGDGGNEAL